MGKPALRQEPVKMYTYFKETEMKEQKIITKLLEELASKEFMIAQLKVEIEELKKEESENVEGE